jgi:thioredoxin reductase (NADPH)
VHPADGHRIAARAIIVATGIAWRRLGAPLPLETSVPGVFAVGDARYRSIKRVASAVGDGATAVRLVQEYLCVADVAEADRNL